MRKKPMQNGGYPHKRQRYSQGGGNGGDRSGGGHHHGQGHRPRRNYAQAREKYLAQARDALAAGDRVLAENYLQHADHCYRMMVEEGYQPRQQQQQQQPASDAQPQMVDDTIPQNTSQLPAFLTASYEQPEQQQKPVDPNTIQNWEERDS